jgi:hypothetical protein
LCRRVAAMGRGLADRPDQNENFTSNRTSRAAWN